MDTRLSEVLEYHAISKHSFNGYAPGPGYLDWANQPSPFRRYPGAKEVPLRLIPVEDSSGYSKGFTRGSMDPFPLDQRFVSQLLQDSLGLSAWKSAGPSTWALRMNPSSGNLHPTEAYVVSGPLENLFDGPVIAHYAPREHLLEIRAKLPAEFWNAVGALSSGPCLFVILTSVYWREAWKYGERAYRYCQHDLGHAVAALATAASGMGWDTLLVDRVSSDTLDRLLNLPHQEDVEAEHADCMLMLSPYQPDSSDQVRSINELFSKDWNTRWFGVPNRLSDTQVRWPWVERMPSLCQSPGRISHRKHDFIRSSRHSADQEPLSLRQVIHRRRSAVAFDGITSMGSESFYQVLGSTLPNRLQTPFQVFDWSPEVHLLVFVHRVDGLKPGLYFLLRNPKHFAEIRGMSRKEFSWERPDNCPSDLPLFELTTGDFRETAQLVSCMQEIAADGCFSLGMLARFLEPLSEHGPFFYPRLYWECGLVGQVLYLEAEAAGLRGTGIGCFFDDAVHDILGFHDAQYQSLYHFTIGNPVEDKRLVTLPPYSEELRKERGFGA